MISHPFNEHIKNLLLLYHKVLEIFSNLLVIGSRIGFLGCGIFFSKGQDSAFLKQSGDKIHEWTYAWDVGCRKQPPGLLDWAKIWIGMTRLKNPITDLLFTVCTLLTYVIFPYTAILSVSNKEGLVEFGKKLHELGFKLIASGGTAKKLRSADILVG